MSSVRWAEGGSFAILPEWILEATISDRAVRLFCILARYADKNGNAIPGRKAMAGQLYCATSTLDLALIELKQLGAVTTAKRNRDDGSQTSNHYLLHKAPPTDGPVGSPTDGPVGNELEPVGTRFPSPNGEGPGGCQTLVGRFVDISRANGSEPPKRVVGQVASQVQKLVAEGVSPERILAGLDMLIASGRIIPSMLPNFVMEAELPPPKRRDGKVSAAEIMASANQLQREGR